MTSGDGLDNADARQRRRRAEARAQRYLGRQWLDFRPQQCGGRSELRVQEVDWTAGSLDIDLGANATLFIDEDTDWSSLDLFITQTQDIVVADGATLTLTPEQANGLNIVGENGALSTGTVNIAGLPNDPDPDDASDAFDFSGISSNIAGTITFAPGVDDVTLDKATDLGAFSVTLDALQDSNATREGQTIRFQNVDQAEREVIVDGDGDGVANGNSTNVAWLFDSVSGPVDTSGYFSNESGAEYTIGRLWFNEALADGTNVEDLFTSLPNSILRVDFADLADLDNALLSGGVQRVIELASFTELPNGLEFSDGDQLEHIESLDVNMGGQVTAGDILIGNIVNPEAGVDSGSITFTTLTINSVLADDTGDLLASDGFDEEQNVKPVGPNEVGDIGVGTNDNGNLFGLDLTEVVLDTGVDEAGNDTTPDATTNVPTGTELEGGTITFDSEVAGSTATLTAQGDNDITFKGIDLTDPEITSFNLDVSGFAVAANLTFTGGSPALEGDAGLEVIDVNAGLVAVDVENGNTVRFGYIWEDDNGDEIKDPDEFVINRDGSGNAFAGIAAPELSSLDVNSITNHTVRFGHLADIDGSDDDTDGDGIITPNGADGIPGNADDENIAFTLTGNGSVISGTLRLTRPPSSAKRWSTERSRSRSLRATAPGGSSTRR